MFQKRVTTLMEDFQALGLAKSTRTSTEELSEAKIVKKKTGKAAKKAAKKRKIAYKKGKAQAKRKAKKYRASATGKRTIKKHAKVVKKMGGTKKGKRIQTSSIERNVSVIENLAKLNAALLEEDKKRVATVSENEELIKSAQNTIQFAKKLAERFAAHKAKYGSAIPEKVLREMDEFEDEPEDDDLDDTSYENDMGDESDDTEYESDDMDADDENGDFDFDEDDDEDEDDMSDDFDDEDEDEDDDEDDFDDEDDDMDDEDDFGDEDDDDMDEAAIDPDAPSRPNPKINPDKPMDKDYIGQDHPNTIEQNDNTPEDGTEGDADRVQDGGAPDQDYVGDEDNDGAEDDLGEDDDMDADDEDETPTIDDFEEEAGDIQTKAELLLQRIKDQKISPSQANGVLNSMVSYLGGAMGMYQNLTKYAAKEDYEKK